MNFNDFLVIIYFFVLIFTSVIIVFDNLKEKSYVEKELTCINERLPSPPSRDFHKSDVIDVECKIIDKGETL